MLTITIKTHRRGCTYAQPHFFILNKGMNSGKPLSKPCPNCFVCLAKEEAEKEFYYWLSFSLWRSNSFHPFLRGSVISFIILDDVMQALAEGEAWAKANPVEFENSLATLKYLERKEWQYHLNLRLIKEVKGILFSRYMRKR